MVDLFHSDKSTETNGRLVVETWPIDRLVEYARNPRKNDEHVERMAGMIREFGFRIPIVAKSDGTVVDGHLRLKAARKLSLPDVPVALADGLSDAQIQAFRLLANKSASWATWDDALLRTELADLRDVGFDLALTGFGDDELSALFADANAGLTDPDDVPETLAEPVTQPGDVWLLGRHRLVCGDATSEVDVALCLAGVRPHLMVTDPPYGVDYDPAWRADRGLSDAVASGVVTNDDRSDWRSAWLLAPSVIAYVWHADLHARQIVESLEAAAFEMRAQIIWAKDRPILSRGNYNFQHEPCWYAVRKGAVTNWAGNHKQTTLWNIQLPWDNYGNRETPASDLRSGHSTQKPVECMRRPIENNSSPGQAVYDPFVSSPPR